MSEPDVPLVQNLGGVFLLDTRHGGYPGTVGVFLLPGLAGTFALIESGPGSTLETVLACVREAGFAPEGLTSVLVTHIHLDHAGAAGALAQRFGAEVYVHKNGAGHLVDPSRLLASARRIYGDRMAEWGETLPVPRNLLRPVRDGETFEVAGHRIGILYTPGHASHHVCFVLDGTRMFAGDAAGIRLPGAETVRPALPPPELDLELWSRSLQAVRQAGPDELLLTHFGRVGDVDGHLGALEREHRIWSESILDGMNAGEDDEALAFRVAKLSRDALRAESASAGTIERHSVTSSDAMTVVGVKRYWQKHHPERLKGSL